MRTIKPKKIIGIYDVDSSSFPNLALMKISAWHKNKKNKVVLIDPKYPLLNPKCDIVYCSKVFTYNKQSEYIKQNKKYKRVIYGGIGYGLKSKNLNKYIEHICPDYDLYGIDYSLGFLTRGCIRKCSWCIVPEKEGNIKPHADIEEFLRHNKAVLMDNNVLACDHGIKQIEKIIKLGIKVDFNQGLDARLIDNSIAKLLSKVKWLNPIRLACDNQSQTKHIQKAVNLLRWHNAHPRNFFVYCLITKDIKESLNRIKFLKGLNVDPFAQPFINFKTNERPNKTQRSLARWVNIKSIFYATTWEEYKYNHENKKT